MATPFDTVYLPGVHGAGQEDFLNFDATFPAGSYKPLGLDYAPQDGTVSPSDLFTEDSLILSAPPSASFPNLSTPESGFLESPNTGLNTSPLVDGLLDGQLNYGELDTMAPLFPPDDIEYSIMAAIEPHVKQAVPTTVAPPPSVTASPMVRQKSSPGRPPSIPFSHGRKHSGAHGISKASSKSRKNLPEITIDSDDDKETAKRKKNTAAARKSRQRKQEYAEASDAEIQRLRAMIFRLGGDPDEGL